MPCNPRVSHVNTLKDNLPIVAILAVEDSLFIINPQPS